MADLHRRFGEGLIELASSETSVQRCRRQDPQGPRSGDKQGLVIIFLTVLPTGEYVPTGLLRSALRALACKSWACLPALRFPAALGRPGQTIRGLPVRRAKGPLDPWQVSGSPMASPFAGRSTFPGSPTPVRRVPFFACPKQGTERKGTPDSAPANFAGSLAPHSSQTVRVRAFLRSRFPLALLERPVRTVRGAPARRGGDSLDPRLFFGSPLALARTREIPLAPLRACSSSLCLTRLE